MNSLRHRLLAGLLTGLGLLWLVAGGGTYLTVRRSLQGTFDAELKAMASEVRHLLPEGRHLEPESSAYWFDFFQPGSGLYFEAWDEYLLFSDRSANLGRQHLPRPPVFAPAPRIWNATLETGEPVRLIARQFRIDPPLGDVDEGQAYVLNVVVARNRDDLDQRLRLLAAATGLTGLLLIPVSLLIVHLAVGRGLRPLRTFAERTEAFGIDSLQERFETAGVPAELQPVSQRLNELLERLAAGVERERRLNEDLAHELRTPVAELKTMAEVALAWPDKITGDNYREILAVATQMQALIDNMLLLAKWERTTERPALQPVDLAALAGQCWQPHAEAARTKGLNVRMAVPAGTTLDTNPELLQIILGNLMANAVEYCPPNGQVDIEAAASRADFSFTIANTVQDFEARDMPRLFERFWRRDAARGHSGHAGLGLALAKTCADILELHLAAEHIESPLRIVFKLSKP